MDEPSPRANTDFVHHQKSVFMNVLAEVVFGVEDGMVSTLGSIVGIAIGSQNHFIVILAGTVIISVESISMGIGSYLSNLSAEEMDRRKIEEEKIEIEKVPEEEKGELYDMYIEEGWPESLAKEMTEAASSNKELMLREMMVRELKINPEQESTSLKGGIYMFCSYILGGLIPLSAYIFLPINTAIPVSVGITLLGLFALGMSTTKFTRQPLLKSGLRVLIMGGLALIAGLVAGLLVRQ
ncbi:VIT1/CCC1 transporter family protein [Candidatus Nomurabacteria bacterium]|nr:VIT1/CCC1 transporter family protein [Candidatus Nomurabacteria bacterium]